MISIDGGFINVADEIRRILSYQCVTCESREGEGNLDCCIMTIPRQAIISSSCNCKQVGLIRRVSEEEVTDYSGSSVQNDIMQNETTLVLESPRVFLPKQLEVFDYCTEYHPNQNTFVLYSGAFGAGKTLLLAQVCIETCLNNPKCLGLVGSQTYPTLQDVVWRKFLEEIELFQDKLDAQGIDIQILKKVNSSPGKMKIIFYNDSEILFRACEDERKLAGTSLDFFALDEPVDIAESVFTQLMGRLRGIHLKQRFGILATNPGAETHWVYEYFIGDIKRGYYTVETSTYDNVLLPNYEAYIHGMEDWYDADWVNRYLKGKWGAFAGQIYKDFDKDRDVGNYRRLIEDGKIEIKHYIAGVDWGFRNPSCILTYGVDDRNHLYLVDEYYQNEKTTTFVSEEIAKRNEKYKYKQVFCDPSAVDLIKQTYDLGVPIKEGNNDVDNGIAKIKSLFKAKIIHVDVGCFHYIKEHESYRYERDKTNKNLTEKPVKKDDHSCDAERYGLTDFDPFRKPSFCHGGRWDSWLR